MAIWKKKGKIYWIYFQTQCFFLIIFLNKLRWTNFIYKQTAKLIECRYIDASPQITKPEEYNKPLGLVYTSHKRGHFVYNWTAQWRQPHNMIQTGDVKSMQLKRRDFAYASLIEAIQRVRLLCGRSVVGATAGFDCITAVYFTGLDFKLKCKCGSCPY